MTRARAAVLLAAAVGAVLLGWPGRAAAADTLTVRRVDTSKFPKVTLSAQVTGPAPDLTAFSVRENGRIVQPIDVIPISKTATAVAIALVIDTSGSMKGTKLAAAKAAAHQFVDHKLPNDRIAIVSFSSEPRVVLNFTDDPALLGGAIDSLAASGETALWDAVRTASGLFADQTAALPYMVVLSDGADTVSKSSADEAIGSAVAAKAGVFAVGLLGAGDFDGDTLSRLSAVTGGQYVETSDASRLGQVYGSVQSVLQNQYEVSYTSSGSGSIEITLVAGDSTATVSAVAGSVSTGGANQPRAIGPTKVPAPMRSSGMRFVFAALLAVSAGLLGLTFAGLVRRRDDSLESALRPYAGGSRQPAPEAAEHGDRSLIQTALVRRAADTTARLVGQGRLIEGLERRLEQADLQLRAQEALFFYLVAAVLVTVVVVTLAGPLVGLAAVLIMALVPAAVLSQLAERRQRAFTRQLPDTLQLLASSLRAGYSLQQGLETVAQEVDDPMERELRRVVLEARLGRSLEEALEETAKRMASPDFDWVVMSIRIQREIGGNLAELLSTVSETMIARERLRREVSALTAEGKLSAIVVGALPILVGIAIFVLNPGYMKVLFTSNIGKGMLLGAVVLAMAGFAWMRKVIQIDV